MTIVELFLFILAIIAIARLLAPLRKRIESYLYKRLRPGKSGPRDVIEIMDYTKKDKPK